MRDYGHETLGEIRERNAEREKEINLGLEESREFPKLQGQASHITERRGDAIWGQSKEAQRNATRTVQPASVAASVAVHDYDDSTPLMSEEDITAFYEEEKKRGETGHCISSPVNEEEDNDPDNADDPGYMIPREPYLNI